MTFRIHMIFRDGSEDYIDISGDTIEELQEIASYEVKRRNPVDYWSIELS